MNLYFLKVNRTQIQQQVVQNLIEAGVLMRSEAEHQITELAKLDCKDLLAVLLESHNLKEEAMIKELKEVAEWIATQSYYIDPTTINCMN